MGAANDLNQRWVCDSGLPGPDAGKGGKHLLLPPGYKDKLPEGYYASVSTMNRVLVLLRAIPPGGNNDAANALMKTAKVYPLNPRRANDNRAAPPAAPEAHTGKHDSMLRFPSASNRSVALL